MFGRDLHYIRSTGGVEELYRISSDPEERINLLEEGGPGAVMDAERMHGWLRAFLADTGMVR